MLGEAKIVSRDLDLTYNHQSNAHNAAKILNEISNGKLADSIVKFIAPNFFLDKYGDNNLLTEK